MERKIYDKYVSILKEELIPAMGCTEPIAVAYAAAVAKKALGGRPEKIRLAVSGNIIKNVKSVVVPHTGGMRGLEAAAAVGIVAGDPDAKLEVISCVREEQLAELREFLKQVPCQVEFADTPYIFDIMITLEGGGHTSFVRILNFHTNIVQVKRDEEELYHKEVTGEKSGTKTDRSVLSVEGIVEFANEVDLADVEEVLRRQIEYNYAIAEAGLDCDFGANIGKVLLNTYGDDVKIRARAKAAAGSDARMNGCELPVVINSGSGNQGITASVPVIEYAKELNVTQDRLYRALVVSNLVAVHLKTGIGALSAFCGAVSAGCGCGAGIAYLYGGDCPIISHTIVNALAIDSGIVCDGAKASCAAKIASSVDAGILGYYMFRNGQQFYGGDGIITEGVENTIANIGKLASEGMRETDKEIIRIMVGCR